MEVRGVCRSQAQAPVVAVECRSSISGRAYPCVAAISGDTPDSFAVTARYIKIRSVAPLNVDEYLHICNDFHVQNKVEEDIKNSNGKEGQTTLENVLIELALSIGTHLALQMAQPFWDTQDKLLLEWGLGFCIVIFCNPSR